MGSSLLAFPNYISGATLSGGSYETTMPLDNIKDSRLAIKARSINLISSNTKISVSLTQTRVIGVVCIANHNLSPNATFRVIGYSDNNFKTQVYDSGSIDVWPEVFSTSTLLWESDSWWSGKYSEEELTGYTRTLVHLMNNSTEQMIVQSFEIEFVDTSNPDGYVEYGRLFFATGWTPVRNISYGAGLGFGTDTTITKSKGGSKFFDVTPQYRIARIQFDNVDEDEGMSQAFELMRTQGIDKEVLFVWNKNDTLHSVRRQFLATIRQLSLIEFPYFEAVSIPFELEEIL